MRMRSLAIPFAFSFALAAFSGAAQAQTPPAQTAPAPQTLPACQSQQELEQVLASGGQFMPDGCRQVSITSLDSEHGPLCVIDFEAAEDPGVLDRLTDAAMPTQWWVLCESLSTIR